ncbi:hypothetical protein N9B57_01940 [Verrucomicrobia bacterium]|nr:hypothetical protein [Verrucomicrobiota bacterium]MDA7866674.1 hypothetical protein [Verrucomicrobiota bacterium]MDB4745720.1 hypothetical protein [Verrucomicrobiota bacterium]
MDTWQQYIIKGITFSVILTAFGLFSLFIERSGYLSLVASILGGGALLAAPVVLMGYLREIL